MREWIQRKLGRKLFLSYLVVVLIGTVVLAVMSQLSAPSAFDRHLAAMAQMMGGTRMMGGQMMQVDLYSSFRHALRDALVYAVTIATAVAIVVSWLISRQILTPVDRLTRATSRLADGHLDERIDVPDAPAGDELSELARSFNRMSQALDHEESLRRELIGNVAHELRTPLATVKGHAEGLIDGILPAEPASFEVIHREASRLETLINDLLELSHVEAGAHQLHRQMVSPIDLADAVVERLGFQFQDKGVILHNQVGEGLPALSVDPDRIGQVLLNLLGNALQSTPAGGEVTLSARREGRQLLFSVSDTGIGIAPEHLPHIFTRFYRVDHSRSRAGGGSGIGLTIARSLAEAHGGSVYAESAGAGLGSTFTLSLPIAQ